MSAKTKEILNLDDVKLLVNTFYDRVRDDEMLAPVFNSVIQDNWPRHLEIMYRFWQTILLDEHTYTGSPGYKHFKLPVGAEHFTRWLALFNSTINELFSGEKADEAKWRAARMAELFQFKIAAYQSNKNMLL